jgi:hypothetical protein
MLAGTVSVLIAAIKPIKFCQERSISLPYYFFIAIFVYIFWAIIQPIVDGISDKDYVRFSKRYGTDQKVYIKKKSPF